MKTLEIESDVGPDGVLSLRVPLGESEANHRVRVTIETAESEKKVLDQEEWRAFVARTYGSGAELGIERGDQGTYEVREPID